MVRTACASAIAALLCACGLSLSGELDATGDPPHVGGDASFDATSSGNADGSASVGDGAPAASDASEGDDDGGDESDAGAAAHDAAPLTRMVKVPATSGPGCGAWFDAGVNVSAGSPLVIAANGQWQYGLGPAFQCGPQGSGVGGSYNGFTNGALIGQIGDGGTFMVGASYDASAPASGALALGIADGLCGDNSGALDVTITALP